MSRYAINRTIFLEKDGLWFGVYNSYAIKYIVRLSNMRLARFVCIHFLKVDLQKNFLILLKEKNAFNPRKNSKSRQNIYF